MNSDLAVVLATLAIYGAIVVSPGPSFAFVLRLATAGERRAGYGATLGLACGATVYAMLAMGGLAAMLSGIGWLARVLQVAAGAYLIWLGIAAWRSAAAPAAPVTGGATDTSRFGPGLWKGFLMCLSNPKAIVFFAGLYASAIPADTALWARAAIIGCAFFMELAWYGSVVAVLSRPAMRKRYDRARQPLQRMTACLLVMFGGKSVAG